MSSPSHTIYKERTFVRSFNDIVIFTASAVLLLAAISCNGPTKPDQQPIQITLDDASCTEAYLKLQVGTELSERTVTLKRDNVELWTRSIDAAETAITDTNLLPGHTYTYTASLISPPPIWIGTNSTSQVQVRTMDTTSHDYQFQTFTLGDGTGSSCLYDVAIINDTLAYAVGEIHRNDTTFNAAKWDGIQWSLLRIPYIYGGSPSYSSIKWLFAINANDIWFGNHVRWDGQSFNNVDIADAIFYGIGSNKMWGNQNGVLCVVGNNGTIAYSSNHGSSWTKMESGTGLQFLDIYGATDQRTGELEILAVCTQNFPGDRGIFSINGNVATQISSNPIAWELFSVWFVPNRHYYVAGGEYYEKKSLNDSVWVILRPGTSYGASKMRGNGLNDAIIVGAYGECLHWNGLTWQGYRDVTGLGNGSYASVAISGNLVIAVGENNARAVILIGRR
jgi:hypothetical protein